MIELEVTGSAARGQHIRTNAPFISIGRSQEHTVVVPDRSVSRHHGEIVLLHEKYQYRDLNSTHGTILRRGDEENFIKQVVLNEGDELVLGQTDNVVRVVSIEADAVDLDTKELTILHASEDTFGPPEKVFAHDSKALRTIVQFDSKLMESNITTERQVFNQLLEHIPRLLDKLTYVAIVEEQDGEIHPHDYHVLREGTRVRLSSNIIREAVNSGGAYAFTIKGGAMLKTNRGATPLSEGSRVLGLEETTGICVPLSQRHRVKRYLQFERRAVDGLLTNEDVKLVRCVASRVTACVENLELVRQNQLLNVNASLGVFAAMIGHDIKNYLFFNKKLGEIRDDPLSKHPGILKGIERSRKLAQGMKELTAPGNVKLNTFSVEALARSVAAEFRSIFGERCRFDAETSGRVSPICTSEDLLFRVIWNLVMNAYHCAENRRRSLTNAPWILIMVKTAGRGDVEIEVQDNAGGIGARTLEYMQRSFDLIRSVHRHQEDLINVVNTISRMEGFTNSVGLFFTAVAVNDMSGEISVTTIPGEGSAFRIRLPKEITELKRLLRF